MSNQTTRLIGLLDSPFDSEAVRYELACFHLVPGKRMGITGVWEEQYWEARGAGIEVLVVQGLIDAFFLHGLSGEFAPYLQPLSQGVGFGMTRFEVTRKLGAPSAQSEKEDGYGGWFYYHYPRHSLHLAFGREDGRLSRVGLTRDTVTRAVHGSMTAFDAHVHMLAAMGKLPFPLESWGE